MSDDVQSFLAAKDAEIASLRRAEGLMCAEIDNKDARIVELEAACAAMRLAIEESNRALTWCDKLEGNPPALALKRNLDTLYTTCGKHLLDRLKEAEWLLRNMPMIYFSKPPTEHKERRDAWLRGGAL